MIAVLQCNIEYVKYLHVSCLASVLVCKQCTNLNLDLVKYLGYIRSHLKSVKNNFTHAYSRSDISNAVAAVLTGHWGITSMMPAKQIGQQNSYCICKQENEILAGTAAQSQSKEVNFGSYLTFMSC